MIEELKIKNFRGFASLELPNLKRINLIVGENNSGKTSLLEAISSFCNYDNINKLPSQFRPTQGDYKSRYYRWLLLDGTPEKSGSLEGLIGGKRRQIVLVFPPTADPEIPKKFSSETFDYIPPGYVAIWQLRRSPGLNCRSISVFQQQFDHKSLVALVGRAQRKSGGEETLQGLLSKVDPRIKKIRVDPGMDNQNENQVIVDIGLSELMPLTQVGQGVNRLMSILADIIGESPDVLLIDEIENGLHHSVQEQVWTGLAEAAEKLNVQIFATTHSDECLRAAHAAFEKRKHYDFSVIQLFRVQSGIQGRTLDKEHIKAAIAGDIDLRT